MSLGTKLDCQREPALQSFLNEDFEDVESVKGDAGSPKIKHVMKRLWDRSKIKNFPSKCLSTSSSLKTLNQDHHMETDCIL